MGIGPYELRTATATDRLVYRLSTAIKKHLTACGRPCSQGDTAPTARVLVSALKGTLASRSRSVGDAILCYWGACLKNATVGPEVGATSPANTDH